MSSRHSTWRLRSSAMMVATSGSRCESTDMAWPRAGIGVHPEYPSAVLGASATNEPTPKKRYGDREAAAALLPRGAERQQTTHPARQVRTAWWRPKPNGCLRAPKYEPTSAHAERRVVIRQQVVVSLHARCPSQDASSEVMDAPWHRSRDQRRDPTDEDCDLSNCTEHVEDDEVRDDHEDAEEAGQPVAAIHLSRANEANRVRG